MVLLIQRSGELRQQVVSRRIDHEAPMVWSRAFLRTL
jgi:hypothetical protein